MVSSQFQPKTIYENSLYLNSGNSRFLGDRPAGWSGQYGLDWSVKFADLDNDGWLDLIGTNGMMQDRTNSDLLNQAKALKTKEEKTKFWKKFPPKKDENFIFRNLNGLKFEKLLPRKGSDIWV